MKLCINTLLSKLIENNIKEKDLFKSFSEESEFKWKARIINKLIH